MTLHSLIRSYTRLVWRARIICCIVVFMVGLSYLMHIVEAKPWQTTLLAAFLLVVDTLGLYWQIPNMRDARQDWKAIADFPEWGKRRVRNRYGSNVIRMIVMPLALALAVTVLFFKQVQVVQPDFVGSVEGTEIMAYILAAEIGFAYLAYRDYHSRATEDDPIKQISNQAAQNRQIKEEP